MCSWGQVSKLRVTVNNSVPTAGHSNGPGQVPLTFWALISAAEKNYEPTAQRLSLWVLVADGVQGPSQCIAFPFCVPLGRLVNLSELWLPHLQNGDNSGIHT